MELTTRITRIDTENVWDPKTEELSYWAEEAYDYLKEDGWDDWTQRDVNNALDSLELIEEWAIIWRFKMIDEEGNNIFE